MHTQKKKVPLTFAPFSGLKSREGGLILNSRHREYLLDNTEALNGFDTFYTHDESYKSLTYQLQPLIGQRS